MNEKLTLLVVDDTDAPRAGTAGMLHQAGYYVEEAETGTAALEKAESLRPDLVLMDVNPPDSHGFKKRCATGRQRRGNSLGSHIMMMTDEHPSTVAVICDRYGVIRSIIHNDLGLENRLAPGRLFLLSLDAQSVQKALNFFQHLDAHGAAADWTLNAPVGKDREVVPLYFAGARLDDGFLIIGARNGGEARRVLDELIRINNEQTNALRASLKEREQVVQHMRQHEISLLAEIMQVNNDLATLQRELAKKSKELARLNELKNQFLAMAAHDLHHPIGVIQMYKGDNAE